MTEYIAVTAIASRYPGPPIGGCEPSNSIERMPNDAPTVSRLSATAIAGISSERNTGTSTRYVTAASASTSTSRRCDVTRA